ncbi:nuclear transport factor 2 family protein [Pseudomonas sp. FP2300]|uniref:nuclear transport factor 2 family protein n=1 Tax=Pseudomonas sp. FP2300 TaxID=2954090 RepID=UPI002735A6FC|nr:nuclear transport factor 2 family protein [Pseudomonas sp. FP2300]WLH65147.1 nuclear transport factor 2 family protein [Pseudomonas sp. FP2300]
MFLENPIERMLAEHACERQIKKFATLNDAGDYEKLVELFTDDGLFIRPSSPDAPVKGKRAILDAFKSRPSRVSAHFVCNTVVELISETEAKAVSNILLVSASGDVTPGVATPPHLVGAFDDTLILQNGAWLFRERIGSIQLRILA